MCPCCPSLILVAACAALEQAASTGKVLTPEDWCTDASVEESPYSYQKASPKTTGQNQQL